MTDTHSPKQNHLLAALPDADYDRLFRHLELFPLPLGWTIYEAGSKLRYLYFPTTSIVSLRYGVAEKASAEIAVTGNDGLVGFALFMGGESTASHAVVQSAGHSYRLKAEILRREFRQGGPLQNLALRYTHTLITQMAHTALCNRHHTISQQLCRRLLLSLDRVSSNELSMTQEVIGKILGVRREGVTDAARHLQQDGLIDYHRGHIHVLDRHKLEARVCECYAAVKKETDRLLPASRKSRARN